MPKKRVIPKFKTEAEEAAWWDNNQTYIKSLLHETLIERET